MALGERAGVSASPNERGHDGHRSRSLGRGHRRCRCCGMLAVLVLATVFVPILPTAGSNWRRSGMPFVRLRAVPRPARILVAAKPLASAEFASSASTDRADETGQTNEAGRPTNRFCVGSSAVFAEGEGVAGVTAWAAHLRSPGVTGDETMRGRDDRLNAVDSIRAVLISLSARRSAALLRAVAAPGRCLADESPARQTVANLVRNSES